MSIDQMDLFGVIGSSAVLSPCGGYRYQLGRTWNPDLPTIGWVMLNPSTADAEQDDPTIRRCIGFARRWDFGGLIVMNLFALRSSDPASLRSHTDPVGPDNDMHLQRLSALTGQIVVAWGTHSMAATRARAVLDLIAREGRDVYCLRVTASGMPKHPLYVPSAVNPLIYLSDQKGK